MARIEGTVLATRTTTLSGRRTTTLEVLADAGLALALLPLRPLLPRRRRRHRGVPRQVRCHTIETPSGIVQVVEDREPLLGWLFPGHDVVLHGPRWGGVLRVRLGTDRTASAVILASPPAGLAGAAAAVALLLAEVVAVGSLLW